MKLFSRAEAQKIDRLSTEQFNIPSEKLMQQAGLAASDHIWKYFEAQVKNGFSVVAGFGNNGGDALVVARELEKRGGRLVSLIVVNVSGSELFRKQLESFGDRFTVWNSDPDPKHIRESLAGSVLIDGLFGIGLNRPLAQEDIRLIRAMQKFAGPVVSLDIPSGIDCDTGWDWGASVLATHTLTFGAAKPGLFLNRGYQACGEVFVLDIGFPEELVGAEANEFTLFQMNDAAVRLPKRVLTEHKANHGRILIIAGSEGRWGAAILCARSASRSGVGFVYVASHEMPSEVLCANPEFLVSKISEVKDFSTFDAVVVGPGLGTGPETLAILLRLKEVKNVVVDADALTAIASSDFKTPSSWILTPHMGEFSRFFSSSVDEIEFNRWNALRQFRDRCKCTVVLKGFHSQVATWESHEKIQIVASGNSALAKAGTGDVLAGLIGGFRAQGLSPSDAAALGCYIHGRAADIYVRDRGHPATLLVSELFEEIPRVFNELSSANAILKGQDH